MGELIIIESPYAGDVAANTRYARRCVRDSLGRGENPIASHLLYTQTGILRDDDPDERARGIEAGLAWRRGADRTAFYVDRGWSPGMRAALDIVKQEGLPYEVRKLPPAEPPLARKVLKARLVDNWKSGLKWPSTWGLLAFVLQAASEVLAVQALLPAEITALVPYGAYVFLGLAVLALIGRFVTKDDD